MCIVRASAEGFTQVSDHFYLNGSSYLSKDWRIWLKKKMVDIYQQ